MPLSLVDGALGEMTRLKPPRHTAAAAAPAPQAAQVGGGGVSAVGAHRLTAIAREVAWPGLISALLTVVVLAYAIQPPQICKGDGENCRPRWGVVCSLALCASLASMGIAYYLRTLTK